MSRTFTQVLALTLVLIASFFLVRSTVMVSKKYIVELSATKVGYSLDVASNLCQQRADTKVGFALLLLSFFLQSVSLMRPVSAKELSPNKNGSIIAIVLSIFILLLAIKVSNHLYKTSYAGVENVIKDRIQQDYEKGINSGKLNGQIP
jgi:hypothetical protein